MNIVLATIAAYDLCSGALLSAGTVSAEAGAAAAMPVTLAAETGEEISVVQFTLEFDVSVLTLAELMIGPAAESAEKDINSNVLEPGVVRVIIAGLNQNAIPDGVLVEAVFDVDAQAPPGLHMVAPANLSLSDPFGIEVPGEPESGGVMVPGEEGEGGLEGEFEGEPCLGDYHSADTNQDGLIDLSELLRVIQIFSSGALFCAVPAEDTEDGYRPGAGLPKTCCPHSSDYNGGANWKIGLTELIRAIQFFNAGAYHACPFTVPPTEDGFCTGPPQ